MTDLLSRPVAGRPDGAATRPRPVAVVAVAAGLWAAAMGLLGVTVVVLLGWATAADSGSSADNAVRTAAQVWLVAHHTGLAVAGGQLGLMPLGLALLPGLLLYRVGGWVGRSGAVRGLPGAGAAATMIAGAYAVVAALVTGPAATPAVRPLPGQAFAGAAVLALVAAGSGVLRSTGLGRAAGAALPPRLRSVLVAALGGAATLLAGGAVLAGTAFALDAHRAVDLSSELGPGAFGGLLLLALGATLAPNAVIWSAAYAAGPGFAVGAGTSVAPGGVHLGRVPALPLLAALPQDGPAPALSLVAVALPLLAGVVAGLLVVRRLPAVTGELAAAWGFVGGVATGALVGVLTALSGGPVGAGRLSTVGPSGLQVGVAVALEAGITAATAAWLAHRRPLS